MSNKIVRRVRNLIRDLSPDSQSKRYAEAKEYWNELNSNVNEMSHWRGQGRWVEEEWKNVGEKHYEMFTAMLRHIDYNEPLQRMMEWGPGGGSNLLKFSETFRDLYGVDISAPNLEECRKQLESAGIKSFVPINIDTEHPEKVLKEVQSPLDFFLCTAVYQHFPGNEYGRRITDIASKLLRKNGLAIIQTRYNDGTKLLQPKDRNYKKNVVVFTAYFIEEFWEEVKKYDFEPLYVFLKPDVKYAYYFLRKK